MYLEARFREGKFYRVSLSIILFIISIIIIIIIEGVQKVYMHLIISKQKITSNIQSVPRQYPDSRPPGPGGH
jgi:competence protein ComGC